MLHNLNFSPISESENAKDDVDDSSDDEESYRGDYFCFNYEERGHIEIECLYLKIESDETKNPNEIEDNLEIEKKKNHEADFSQKERELEYEIITLKIKLEEEKRTKEFMRNQMYRNIFTIGISFSQKGKK
jgi:hypothetical protein